jgi:DNA-binding IclR family transcriptional regulator
MTENDLAKGSRRVTEVLDFVARARTAPSARQIFEGLDLPRSSGYDLLNGLLRNHYLEKHSDDRWVLGDELQVLAMARFGLGRVAPQIPSVLSELQEVTQEAALLAVLNGTRVLVTHLFSSARSIPFGAEIGVEVSVNWTAAGYLLLSKFDERSLRRFLAANARASPTSHAAVVIEQLARDVRMAKRRGYAIEIGQACQGIASIAAPVADARGDCIAAVSLGLPIMRMLNCQDTLVSLVRSAAAKLTCSLPAER